MFFFSYIFWGFLCILCTSAAPQRPAHGTVSSQVATHHRTDRVCHVLGGAGFEPRTTDLQPVALPLSHLSSSKSHLSSSWATSPPQGEGLNVTSVLGGDISSHTSQNEFSFKDVLKDIFSNLFSCHLVGLVNPFNIIIVSYTGRGVGMRPN